MSMIYPHPVLDPNALAKSVIDAVTGHQPSPLDSEYSSETPICTTRRLRSAKVRNRPRGAVRFYKKRR
jgi:hypothetical protein